MLNKNKLNKLNKKTETWGFLFLFGVFFFLSLSCSSPIPVESSVVESSEWHDKKINPWNKSVKSFKIIVLNGNKKWIRNLLEILDLTIDVFAVVHYRGGEGLTAGVWNWKALCLDLDSFTYGRIQQETSVGQEKRSNPELWK